MSTNHNWFDEPERSLEPEESTVDGYLRCCECEQVIPGDEWYFQFGGNCYCESCVDAYHRHLAPYRDEVEEDYE